MAVLLAYAKNSIYDELLPSDLPDDPQLEEDLVKYFPGALQKSYKEQIGRHRLRREIVATMVTNDIVNRMGMTFVHELRERTGLPVAAPITDSADVEAIGDTVDVVQLAGSHMQNYRLLKELGQLRRPVILRRGTANTVDELVSAAEYVLVEGNPNVILCEHGIRTFERLYELTVDVAAVPLLKERTHLPIVVDPSVGGRTNVVGALALAAAAAGADGIILESEPQELDAYLDVVARATACAATLQHN
jgi:3-deoxy-7-phosphoheptulonate synthase